MRWPSFGSTATAAFIGLIAVPAAGLRRQPTPNVSEAGLITHDSDGVATSGVVPQHPSRTNRRRPHRRVITMALLPVARPGTC